jgi:hypothetical protein
MEHNGGVALVAKCSYGITQKPTNRFKQYYMDTQTLYHFFFFFVCEAIGTVATPGLLCRPQVIVKMIVEKQMEHRLAGETEVLEENLSQRHFCPSQNPVCLSL